MATVGIGREFAGYRIESLVGEGGMGVVYLAEHLRLQRKVALKVVRPELARDPAFRERFVREARMAAALEHPNIIPVYDAGETDGILYLAMRYVRGTDLKDLVVADGPLQLDRTLDILGQIGSALDAAHHEGLVHRDVKPRNVLVAGARSKSGREQAFLTDFGLTKRTESGSALTRTGFFLGTIDYAAPEQIMGKHLDGRADQYALACVLYECLAGIPPYARDSDVAVMYAHLQEPPPPLSSVRPDLPLALDAVIAKGMAKEPDDRFPTCEDMIDAAGGAAGLSHARGAGGSTAGGLPATAAAAGSTAWAAPPAPLAPPIPPAAVSPVPSAAVTPVPDTGPVLAVPTAEQPASGPPKEPPRPRRGWIFGGAGAAAVVVAVIALLLSSHSTPVSKVSSPPPTTRPPTTRPPTTRPPTTRPPTTRPPTTRPPTTQPGIVLAQPITSQFFAMRVPAGFAGGIDTPVPETSDRCAPRPQTFFETRLVDPNNSAVRVVVDVTPQFSGTAESHIRCEASHRGGAVDPIQFQGSISAFRWDRLDGSQHEVNIQFEVSGTLYALLGEAPTSSFSQFEPTLLAIGNSFEATPTS